MAGQLFRAGVVVVVRHPDRHQILAVERADTPGAWQLPQGGIDKGEEPQEAAWRELAEETALGPDDVDVLAEFPEWVVSQYPDEIRARFRRRRGQVHKWFLFQARTGEPPVRCDRRELAGWRWVEPAWLVDNVVGFRQAAYRRVLTSL